MQTFNLLLFEPENEFIFNFKFSNLRLYYDQLVKLSI